MAEVLAFLLGTLFFLFLISALPVMVRVRAYKEMGGPLCVRVFLWPWRLPFTLESSEWDLDRVVALIWRGGGQRERHGAGLAWGTNWLKKGIVFWRDLRRVSQRLYRAVTCYRWELHLVVGGNGAAATAWLAGAGWWWQAAVRQNLATRLRLRTVPVYSVRPSFTGSGFGLRLDSIFTLTLIHLILAGLGLAVAGWRLRNRPEEARPTG